MSFKQKVVKGIFWSAVQSWGSQAASLLVFFVLARLLEPQDFGLIALANVFLAFMQIFLNQGFAQAIVQRQELEPEHLDTAFWTNLAIGLLLTLTGIASADLVANLFAQSQLVSILQVFSILFLITSVSGVHQALLERKLAFKAIAIRWLMGTLAGGLVGITLALYGFGIWSLVYQQLVQEFVGACVLWCSSDWRPRWRLSGQHLQQLFGFGISLLGFNLLNFLNTRTDDFLIGYFLGPVALGYYAIAYRILGVLTQLLVNTSKQVALPAFSQLQQDIERFRKAFYVATQLTSLVAFPIFLSVIALAPELITVLFGNQWLPSIAVLQVLALAGICQSVSFFKSSVFIAMGKPTWTLWLGLLATGLNLIGFAIAVRWGIVAVASAFVMRSYVLFPVGQWAVSRLIQVPLLPYLRQFVTPLMSSLGVTVVILGIKQILGSFIAPQFLIGICAVAGTLVYALTIRFFAPNLFQTSLKVIRLGVTGSEHQNA